MSLTRRRFTQILASTLFLHHLPSFALSVNFWASLTLPEAQNITRIVSAGAPADLLLLAVAPEKMVGFSSFDFARQALIPLPEHIRQLPRLGRLAGRASTLSLEGLMALHPDLVVDCGNTDETWISQARQVSEQTQIPWLLLNGKLEQSAEQLTTLGKTLGEEHRAAENKPISPAASLVKLRHSPPHPPLTSAFMLRAVLEGWKRAYRVRCIPRRRNY